MDEDIIWYYGDDYVIVEEDFTDYVDIEPDDITESEEDGHQTAVTRPNGTFTNHVDELTRSYTQIDAGKITFGVRGRQSLVRTPLYTIQPDYKVVSGTTYYGIEIAAGSIMIEDNTTSGSKDMALRVGLTDRGKTGYMSVVTAFNAHTYGVSWTVEYLPFRNGICISAR